VDGMTMVKSEHKLEMGQFVDVSLEAIRDYDMIGALSI
jgi:hypothetical protein